MRIVNSLWIFYRKLIIPSFIICLAIEIIEGGIMGSSFSIASIGLSYIFLTPFFHFLIYEL